jgi:hypothetical protein
LVAQIDGLQKAEKETGEAYLRLRGILGAFRTPHAPTCEQVWAHTEERARELQAQAHRLRLCAEAALGDLHYLLNHQKTNLVDGSRLADGQAAHELLCAVQETPAQSVAHIEAAVLRRVAALLRPVTVENEHDNGYDTALCDLLGQADRLERGEVDVTVCAECVQPYESHRSACPYCLERDA